MRAVKSLELAAYTDGRPNRLGRILNGINYWWARLAIGPTFNEIAIEVPGRKSGKPRRFVVLVAKVKGQRYLVSMMGEGSGWLRNIRANGHRAALRKRFRREPLRFEEVPPDERAPILKEWAERAPGGRQFLPISHKAPLAEFAVIGDRFPVLRIVDARP